MSGPVSVIFIHGLSNKPDPKVLKRKWLDALSEDLENNPGFNLPAKGVRDSFIYWADLFHEKPLSAEEYESIGDELGESVKENIVLSSNSWMESMVQKFPFDEDGIFEDAPTGENDSDYERIPLPWAVKKQFIKHFLQEAHDYLFNVNDIQTKIRQKVVHSINAAKKQGNVILAGHSQGAIIAYDVLTGEKDCPEIDGLMTFGSPLGIDEVQDKLIWTRENGFPAKLKGKWFNVYDSFDVVSRLDPKHRSDFKQNGNEVVIDINENNWGAWRHSATKYLKGKELRNSLRELTGRIE